MLTPEQVAFYHANGYTTVPNILPDAELAELRQVTDEFVDKSRQATDHTAEFDLEPGHTPEAPRLRRLKHPESLHPAYDRVFRNEHIIDMVAQLVGPDVRHFGGKLNLKSAGFGSPVEWHQDYAFGSTRSNDDMLAVGVAIDDMTPENGCMLVVPGSHKGPIFNHYQDDVFAGAVTDPDFVPDPIAPLLLNAGDISIHHGRLLHASAPNRTPDRPRRFYLLQYCAADSWTQPLSPEEREVYKTQMLRGELPESPRFVDAPPVPRPAQPRTGRGGSIYEQQTHLQQRLFEEA
jgi:phytanoyl-CoA hydroxylase